MLRYSLYLTALYIGNREGWLAVKCLLLLIFPTISHVPLACCRWSKYLHVKCSEVFFKGTKDVKKWSSCATFGFLFKPGPLATIKVKIGDHFN